MKTVPAALVLLGVFFPLLSSGQERAWTTPEWDVALPAPLIETSQKAPLSEPEPIDFKVLSSRTHRIHVSEASELPELPPVAGIINVTVQAVEDPGLPDPPPPAPTVHRDADDPVVAAQIAELMKHYHPPQMAIVSATVYDHSRTLLRIHPSGLDREVVTAWSNIDFNHFSGFSSYRVTESDGAFTDYNLLMGIGNSDTQLLTKMLAKHGQRYQAPLIPELADLAEAGPDFIVIDGDRTGLAMDMLSQLHALYEKERPRMEMAYHTRVKARAERKTFLLAHPPKPKDITVRFWKREGPRSAASPAATPNQTREEQP